MTKQDVYTLLQIRARMAEIKVIAARLGPGHSMIKADIDVTDTKVQLVYQMGCVAHGRSEGNHLFCLHSVDVLAESGNGNTDSSLEDVVYLINDGPCVGDHRSEFEIEIPSWLAAAGLTNMGSDPSFFELDDDGNMTTGEP